MKIRIHNDAIRLRLSQTEVNQLAKGMAIREELPFPAPYSAFVYALEIADIGDKLTVSFLEGKLSVNLPASKINNWANTDQVGISETISLEAGTNLHVLIEKDFQCLHKRPGENEKDNFPNPQA